MRVLWVEDLGADAKTDALLEKLKGWLDESVLDNYPALVPGSGWDYPRWREHYLEMPTPNSNEVDFCIELDVLEATLSSRDVVERYDAILIDINLIDFTKQGGWEKCPDPARGGFWVYQRLLHLGFPSERLAFLTGNGDKAEAFRKQAHELMLDAPQSFDKTSCGASDWLSGLEQDSYLRFRRGVIEGCDFLAGRIESGNSDFSHYFKKDADPGIDWRGYLESLRTALPASLEGYSPKQVSRLFLRALGWPWEERANPDNLNGHDTTTYKQLLAIGWTMKCLRNWSSHGPELDEAGFGDLALFALFNFRALNLAGDEMRPYEKQLCGSGGKSVEARLMGQLLAESYLRVDEKTPSDATRFNDLLNKLANKHDRELNYPRELRKVFWHLLAGQKREAYVRLDSQLTKTLRVFLQATRYPRWVQSLADATFADTFQPELSALENQATARR